MKSADLHSIFLADNSHIRLAAAMHQQCFSKAWDEMSFMSALSIAGTTLQIGSIENDPVAFCLYRSIDDEAEILTLGVIPVYRQQNIASNLLGQGTKYLQQKGVGTIWLEVGSSNLSAQRLYEKSGFVEEGRRKNYYKQAGKTEDAIVMKLDLGATPL
jgi:ribosomal-protein-alanine acetyltransferase